MSKDKEIVLDNRKKIEAFFACPIGGHVIYVEATNNRVFHNPKAVDLVKVVNQFMITDSKGAHFVPLQQIIQIRLKKT